MNPNDEYPTPVHPDQVIAAELAGTIDPTKNEMMVAQRILRALDRASVVVMAPQDVEWGECPSGTEDEPMHRVALNMCAGCLEYDPE